MCIVNDFIAINETLIFPSESVVEDVRCVLIPIIDDTLEEDVESFFVFAYAIGPCAEILDDYDRIVVSIIDNDGKILCSTLSLLLLFNKCPVKYWASSTNSE